jgi:hypothetical protein
MRERMNLNLSPRVALVVTSLVPVVVITNSLSLAHKTTGRLYKSVHRDGEDMDIF